jgi:hypothetical protein
LTFAAAFAVVHSFCLTFLLDGHQRSYAGSLWRSYFFFALVASAKSMQRLLFTGFRRRAETASILISSAF